jgi:hypothetical protein
VALSQISKWVTHEGRRLGTLQTIMCRGSPVPVDLKRATRDRLGCEAGLSEHAVEQGGR